MNKKFLLWQFAYYALSLLIYMACVYVASLVLNLSGGVNNLGTVIFVTNGVLFLVIPVVVAVLMRFSLFRWYVDPISAAEFPIFLYISMLLNQMKLHGNFLEAFYALNSSLSKDGGKGWLFLTGIFFFALVMSFSIGRKNGSFLLITILRKVNLYGHKK